MGDNKTFRVWACNNGEECGGHQDGDHGRRHTIEAHSAERAAEEAGEEMTGVFGGIDVNNVIADGLRVHVVDPDGVETTWAIEAKVRFDARAAEWKPWTATIQWLPEPLRSAALKTRLFADSRKVVALDGVTWITNGYILLRAGAAAPDDFARLPEKNEPFIREALQYDAPLTEQSRAPVHECGTVVATFSNGALANAACIDFLAGVFPDVLWFASKHLTEGNMDREPDPVFVAASGGEVVALVWPLARQKAKKAG